MKYFCILMLSFLFVSSPAQAKKAKSIGEEFWFSSGFEYSFLKSFSIEYSLEQRFELNNDRERSFYNEIKPSFEIINNFKIDAGLRLRTKVENTNPEYISSITYKYSLWVLDLSGRLRYHKKIENDDSEKDYLRTKFLLSYDITKHISVQANTEFFYRFLYDDGDRFDKSRSGLEIDYEFVKNWELSAFWLYESEFNVSKPNDTRIFGLSIGVKFK